MSSDRGPRLVGRSAELLVIDAALEAVCSGRARVVGIVGEPGIGKTRLLAEVAERARARGALVGSGRAGELESDVPFGLLAEVLETFLAGSAAREALRAIDDDQVGLLAAAVPDVAELTGVDEGSVGSSGERQLLARAVRSLLESLAVSTPVVALFDDVHWADPASADALQLLA
jgi:predicted ATPase